MGFQSKEVIMSQTYCDKILWKEFSVLLRNSCLNLYDIEVEVIWNFVVLYVSNESQKYDCKETVKKS